MNTLDQFQAAIAGAVMRPLGPGDAMRRENRMVANELIKPNDRLSSSDRLQIYNQQYWWRLLGAFSEDFRGLRAVLGERKFNRLAVAYLQDCGSTSWNLRDLGSHLEDYLREHPGLIAPLERLSLDMASVEWARVVAFDGEQKPVIDVQEFSKRSPEEMTLGVQPYVTLLELRHPVDRMLQRLKHAESSSASNAMSGGVKTRRIRLTAKATPSPIHLAVHRSDLSVYYKRLEPEAYHLLLALREGSPLEEACCMVFGETGESATGIAVKVQTWFTSWMAFGWLCEREI